MAAIMRQDGARPFVTFGVGDMAFAVPLAEVLEILRPPEVVRIPLGPPSLEGLARHRGEVMPVIGLRRILGLPDAEREAGARVLVARHRGQPVGLVVDRINGLASVEDGRIVAADGAEDGTGAAIDEALLAGAIRPTDGGDGALILAIGPVVERQFADLGRIGGGQIAGRAGGFGGTLGEGLAEAAQAGRDAAAAVDEARLVVFAVAGQEFALPVEHVQEIVPVPKQVTRVPRARAHLLGMMTLRDALLPLVGLRELFGLDAEGEETGRRVVVVRTDEGLVGVVVNGVREIRRIPHGRIDPVPPLLAREAEFEDVAGIARVDGDGRLVSVLSAARLFRRGTALGTGSKEEGAGMAVGGMAVGEVAAERGGEGRVEPFVVFRLAGAEYGLPVAAVREVLRRPDAPTPLPNAPDFVRGVVTLRGAVLPVIDQRRLLRLPEAETAAGERARVVVIAAGEALAGLLVDGMAGIVRVPEGRIETAPVVSQAQHRLIRRVATLDDPEAPDRRRMILLMDPGELLDMDQLAALLVAA